MYNLVNKNTITSLENPPLVQLCALVGRVESHAKKDTCVHILRYTTKETMQMISNYLHLGSLASYDDPQPLWSTQELIGKATSLTRQLAQLMVKCIRRNMNRNCCHRTKMPMSNLRNRKFGRRKRTDCSVV